MRRALFDDICLDSCAPSIGLTNSNKQSCNLMALHANMVARPASRRRAPEFRSARPLVKNVLGITGETWSDGQSTLCAGALA